MRSEWTIKKISDIAEFNPKERLSKGALAKKIGMDKLQPFASDEEGNYLCVRQFRQGIREVTTEFPAGGIERTDGQEYGSKTSAESALDCAKRELMEETGYASDEWEHLITIPSNATVSDNYAYVFMAKNCRKAGDQNLDETECLNVETHTAAEIDTMIHTGKFQQSVHVMAWLLAKEDV